VFLEKSWTFRLPVKPGLVFPPPITNLLEHRRERHTVWRYRITDVWWNALLVMSQKDTVIDHFMEMPDQVGRVS
jgi:hypothetical protein